MAIRELKDVRGDYAKQLREISNDVATGPKQPVGIYVVVFWNDGGVTCAHKRDDGFHPLAASGFMLKEANKLGFTVEEKVIS